MNRIITIFLTIIACAMPAQAEPWDMARSIVLRDEIADSEFAEFLAHSHAAVRKSALFRLMERGNTRHEAMIAPLLRDSSWSVRRQAAQALEYCGTLRMRGELEKIALGRDSAAVRSRAIYALGHLADSRSTAILVAILDDSVWDARGVAADQLRIFGDTSMLEILDRLGESDPTSYVRLRARDTARLLRASKLPPTVTPIVEPASVAPTSTASLYTALLLVIPLGLGVAMFFGSPRIRRAASLTAVAVAVILTLGMIALLTLSPQRARSGLTVECDPTLLLRARERFGISDQEFLNRIRVMLEKRIPDKIKVAQGAPDFSEARETTRVQLNADKVLDLIASRASGRHAVLTYEDLYQEPFHHTMGLGRTDHAVISAWRVDPVRLEEGPGDPSDREIFFERMEKLFVHEIGHLYSLGHCDKPRCVMRSIEAVAEFYRMDTEFCPSCRERMRTVISIAN